MRGVKGIYGERGYEEETRVIGIVLSYKLKVENNLYLYPLSTLVLLCLWKKRWPTPYGIDLKLS